MKTLNLNQKKKNTYSNDYKRISTYSLLTPKKPKKIKFTGFNKDLQNLNKKKKPKKMKIIIDEEPEEEEKLIIFEKLNDE